MTGKSPCDVASEAGKAFFFFFLRFKSKLTSCCSCLFELVDKEDKLTHFKQYNNVFFLHLSARNWCAYTHSTTIQGQNIVNTKSSLYATNEKPQHTINFSGLP